MNKVSIKQLLTRYGNQVKAAEALGVTVQAVSLWVKKGRLPPLRQYQILELWAAEGPQNAE